MRTLSFLISFLIVGFFLSISYFLFALGPVTTSSRAQGFEVKNGEGLSGISQKLKDVKLIRSENVFRAYALISGSAHLLKPGHYLLNAASGTPAILEALVKGEDKETVAVIVEGMSLKDIEEKLDELKVLPKGAISKFDFKILRKDYEFLANAKGLEGYLFPDTYRFFKESSVELVIRKFLDNFQNKAWPLFKKCKISSGFCHGFNDYQVLTLASLVEKEVPFAADRGIVSGIFIERLSIGVGLQADATLTYVKCGGKFVYCDQAAVNRGDLKLASAYNTYLNKGLPPGPISNPGKEAIFAVVNPQKSEYFYYLSDPKTKKTIFSKTLEEHIENRAKYLGL